MLTRYEANYQTMVRTQKSKSKKKTAPTTINTKEREKKKKNRLGMHLYCEKTYALSAGYRSDNLTWLHHQMKTTVYSMPIQILYTVSTTERNKVAPFKAMSLQH